MNKLAKLAEAEKRWKEMFKERVKKMKALLSLDKNQKENPTPKTNKE